MRTSTVTSIVVALATAVPGAPPPDAGGAGRALVGSFGGEGIRVAASATESRIQVQCQLASVDKAISLDDQGRFALSVAFVALQGAPLDDVQDRPQAQVVGRVEGDALRLTIASSGSEADGTFTLRRNARAKLPNCRLRN